MKPILTTRTYINIFIIGISFWLFFINTQRENTVELINDKLKYGSFGVIFVRNDTISVGTDSRITNFGNPLLDNPIDTACKCITNEKVIFASCGLSEAGKFKVINEARKALSSKGSLVEKIAVYDKNIISFLNNIINNANYKSQMIGDETFMKTMDIFSVFCTIIDKSPTIYKRKYKVERLGNKFFVDTNFSIDRTRGDEVSYILFGTRDRDIRTHNFIRNLGIRYLTFAKQQNIIDIIVEKHKQITYNNSIGGNIDIVQLEGSGKIKWIRRKPNCKD